MQTNDKARHQRLDELFADEPHLSPTMKARRLHEKLEAAQAANRPAPPVVPPLPDFSVGTQTVSLARAAEILRSGAGCFDRNDATTLRLLQFRRTTLAQWLADAPELCRASPAERGERTL